MEGKIRTYNSLGKGSGFFVSSEDLKFVPFSKSRCERCWIGENGRLSVFSWDLGEATNIPERHYWKIAASEQDGETGEKTLERYLESIKS